jgi:uncharacterized protein YndB with AHSA1/START domain
VWKLLADPHHLPRWWPGVARVEAVEQDRFTEVHMSKRGRAVRMDFLVVASDPPDPANGTPGRRVWEQELDRTPFERVLRESVTMATVEPDDGTGTRVTLELRMRMRGYSRTGGFMVKRAARRRLDEALDGLARILT